MRQQHRLLQGVHYDDVAVEQGVDLLGARLGILFGAGDGGDNRQRLLRATGAADGVNGLQQRARRIVTGAIAEHDVYQQHPGFRLLAEFLDLL